MKIYTRWCLFYLLSSSPSASSAFEWTNFSSPNGSYTFAYPQARWTPNKPHRIVYDFIQLMGWCFYCVVTNESECIVSRHIHSCLWWWWWRRWAVERKPKRKYWKTTMYILLPKHTRPISSLSSSIPHSYSIKEPQTIKIYQQHHHHQQSW